jgi:hypothetical protein
MCWLRRCLRRCAPAQSSGAIASQVETTEAEMADRDTGHHPSTDPMTPEVRDRLCDLIATELGAAWDAAVAAGADPEELAEIVEQRQRRIESAPVTTDEGSR